MRFLSLLVGWKARDEMEFRMLLLPLPFLPEVDDDDDATDDEW